MQTLRAGRLWLLAVISVGMMVVAGCSSAERFAGLGQQTEPDVEETASTSRMAAKTWGNTDDAPAEESSTSKPQKTARGVDLEARQRNY